MWNAGRDELKNRIEQKEPCAQFFGGRDKALKALDQMKAQMGTLPDPIIARIKGNDVTLDSTRFVEAGTTLKVARFDRIEGAAKHYSTRLLDLSGKISRPSHLVTSLDISASRTISRITMKMVTS